MVLWAFLAIWWLTGPGKSSLAQTLTNNNGLMTCFHMKLMNYDDLWTINDQFDFSWTPSLSCQVAFILAAQVSENSRNHWEGSVEPAEGCWCTSGMGWSSAFFKGAPKLVFGIQKHHVGGPLLCLKGFPATYHYHRISTVDSWCTNEQSEGCCLNIS